MPGSIHHKGINNPTKLLKQRLSINNNIGGGTQLPLSPGKSSLKKDPDAALYQSMGASMGGMGLFRLPPLAGLKKSDKHVSFAKTHQSKTFNIEDGNNFRSTQATYKSNTRSVDSEKANIANAIWNNEGYQSSSSIPKLPNIFHVVHED